MRPSGNSPLNATEVGLLHMADAALRPSLPARETPNSGKANVYSLSLGKRLLLVTVIVAVYTQFHMVDHVSRFVATVPFFERLDMILPGDWGRIMGAVVIGVTWLVVEMARRAALDIWNRFSQPLAKL